MKQYENNEKVNQRGLEELLSFYFEEGYDASDGCINAQNWYHKGEN